MMAVEHVRRSDNWETVMMTMALLFDPYQGWGENRLHQIKELKRALAEKAAQLGLPHTIYGNNLYNSIYYDVNYSLGIVGVITRLQVGNIVGTTRCERLTDAEFESEKERILSELLA